ncbi:MAG: hypothetical protein ACLQUW_03835 [Desulfobaccales bacterium]
MGGGPDYSAVKRLAGARNLPLAPIPGDLEGRDYPVREGDILLLRFQR